MRVTSFQAGVARVAVFALLLVIGTSAWSCNDKEGKDTLHAVAKALHRVANATARADEVTHRFFLDGVITAQEAEFISLILVDINKASAEFQKKARTYSEFDATAQADILKIANDTRDFINGRISDGTLRIKDERARAEWRAIVNTAYDAFGSIVQLVRVAKPKPTPAPTTSGILHLKYVPPNLPPFLTTAEWRQ